MPPLDFPPGTPGATYTGPNGTLWSWDGAKWLAGTSANVYAPIASPAFTGNPTAPTPAAGDADTSLATTQFVSDAVATSLHDVGRNYIHNSMFNVQQRGAGPWSAGQYTADRWVVAFTGGTCQININPASDAGRSQIGDEDVRYYLGAVFTGTAGVGDFTRMIQSVEGVRRLAGKTVTVSFWALAAVAGVKIGVSLDQIFGNGGSPSASVTLNGQSFTLAATWARYSATFTFPSVAGMTFGTAGDDRTQLDFWYSSGATNNVRAGNIGVQSGTIQLWGVQLELGPTATPLEKLDPVTQLQQCQRFYCVGGAFLAGTGVATVGFGYRVTFPTFMRATNPALTFTPTGNVNMGTVTISADGADGALVYGNPTTSNVQTQLRGTYTASADL